MHIIVVEPDDNKTIIAIGRIGANITHGPRHNNDTRTWRQISIDNTQN